MNKYYDVLIVGTGISGSVIANELHKKGYEVLVLEKRKHKGGNCYTNDLYNNGIPVHQYGAHIFRTDKQHIWDYVNSFTKLMPYKHKVVVTHNGNQYSFPINLMTLQQVFGKTFNPKTAETFLENCKSEWERKWKEDIGDIPEELSLEEHCIRQIGKELYEIFVKGYTEKQWGRPCSELPSSIIKRIPVRTNYNDTYFDSSKIYEGMPLNGYTELFDNLLKDITVVYGIDYNLNQEYWNKQARTIVYTGAIDELYDYPGLEWRSLEFETKLTSNGDYQGVPVMNFTDEYKGPKKGHEFTRIIEHRHFYPWKLPTRENESPITYEYPRDWKKGLEKYYPIQSERNLKIVKDLTEQAERDNIILCGRLAEYKYYDMDDAIINALNIANKFESKNEK